MTTEIADEAVNDPDAVWYDPDPASNSGLGVRVVGYSHTYGAVLVVLLLRADQDEVSEFGWIGLNAWRANDSYRNRYLNGEEEVEHHGQQP